MNEKSPLKAEQIYGGFIYIKEISFDKFKITGNILVLKVDVTCLSRSFIQCTIRSSYKEEYIGLTDERVTTLQNRIPVHRQYMHKPVINNYKVRSILEVLGI